MNDLEKSTEETLKQLHEFVGYYRELVGDANGRISSELVSRERDNCLVIRLRGPLPKLAHNKITLLFRVDEATHEAALSRLEEMTGTGSSEHPPPTRR